jgi:hypothetical protein
MYPKGAFKRQRYVFLDLFPLGITALTRDSLPSLMIANP